MAGSVGRGGPPGRGGAITCSRSNQPIWASPATRIAPPWRCSSPISPMICPATSTSTAPLPRPTTPSGATPSAKPAPDSMPTTTSMASSTNWTTPPGRRVLDNRSPERGVPLPPPCRNPPHWCSSRSVAWHWALALVAARLLDVVDKHAVADAGRVARPAQLKRDEPAVVAHHRVRAFVARVVAEVGQPLVPAAAIECEFPNINVARAPVILAVAFDERECAVRKNALRRIIFFRRVGVLRYLLCRQVDAAHVGKLAAGFVGAKDQLAFVGRPEILCFHRTAKREIATIEDRPPVRQLRRPLVVNH